ncbi:hypothetical protein E1211_07655 [Micromonospora sp. 15K316]|uniref:hypothetical protein n=1 Tax=Micromonospora sp. 15K316 TaxID=2530376 RepID=UPI00104A52F5|nr:hypothetical protein [Micromonospora sp. 15K316]TDC38297.1 hypothetical protein E1211_07655 [Micromonospora sp. 15K316]
MAAAVVSLVVAVVLVVAVAVFVGWRDRNRLSSDEDLTAAREATTDQHRHGAESQFASGMAANHHMPNG